MSRSPTDEPVCSPARPVPQPLFEAALGAGSGPAPAAAAAAGSCCKAAAAAAAAAAEGGGAGGLKGAEELLGEDLLCPIGLEVMVDPVSPVCPAMWPAV